MDGGALRVEHCGGVVWCGGSSGMAANSAVALGATDDRRAAVRRRAPLRFCTQCALALLVYVSTATIRELYWMSDWLKPSAQAGGAATIIQQQQPADGQWL